MLVVLAVLVFAITCGVLSVNIPAGIAMILLILSAVGTVAIREYNKKMEKQRRRALFRIVK
ncbi:hypothetical protein [Niallia oryzisoli]|uniref:hypothetical protein n=1 Tax=Niallia oryzisoli TaxID=1737571 RepID=UPI003735EE0C